MKDKNTFDEKSELEKDRLWDSIFCEPVSIEKNRVWKIRLYKSLVFFVLICSFWLSVVSFFYIVKNF